MCAAVRVGDGPFDRDGFVAQRQCDNHRFISVPFRYRLQRYERGKWSDGFVPVNRQPLADDVGVDAMADGDAGHRGAWLQAFLHDLGLEGFGVRASLAHENPGDKGDRVRLKYADTIALNSGFLKVCSLAAYGHVIKYTRQFL